MADYCVKRIDDMEAIYWGAFRRARGELDITSFGAQVLEFPPNATGYPEHDHAGDGQEELYVVLRGGGEIEIDGDRHAIDPDTMVSVKANARRKVFPGDEGMRLLVVGGTPGRVYEFPEISVLGSPDPVAGMDPPAQ